MYKGADIKSRYLHPSFRALRVRLYIMPSIGKCSGGNERRRELPTRSRRGRRAKRSGRLRRGIPVTLTRSPLPVLSLSGSPSESHRGTDEVSGLGEYGISVPVRRDMLLCNALRLRVNRTPPCQFRHASDEVFRTPCAYYAGRCRAKQKSGWITSRSSTFFGICKQAIFGRHAT